MINSTTANVRRSVQIGAYTLFSIPANSEGGRPSRRHAAKALKTGQRDSYPQH
jgi:hypothetical protein